MPVLAMHGSTTGGFANKPRAGVENTNVDP